MITKITELLEIQYPILEGGMAYIGDGVLAAAVSNAGGLGQIGSAGRSLDDLSNQIMGARELTTNPLGVNLPIGEHKSPQPYIEVMLSHKKQLQVVTLSAGNPKPYIQMFRSEGLKVGVVVSTLLQARKAVDAGASFIIVEGSEAGGHNGPAELSTFTLVPLITSFVEVPVLAAGGIVDGRTFAAALVMGADGVQLGTRLVATQESCAHPTYKQAIVTSSAESTVIIERSIGRSTRVLRSPYTECVLELEKQGLTPDQLYPYIQGIRNKTAVMDGEFEQGYAYASQGVGLIQDIPTVEEVLKRMMRDASDAFEKVSQYTLRAK